MSPVNEKAAGILSSTGLCGSGLVRPECVLTHASGFLFCSDWAADGGVAAISPEGAVRRILCAKPGMSMRPNGIALEAGGSFLFAHLGTDAGGVFRLWPDGVTEPVLVELGGRPLPPTNFILLDSKDRLWLSVSTTITPRANDYRQSARTGFIAVLDNKTARIVADGLGYANEFVISPDEQFLFVNETFARRITRFKITTDAQLLDPVVVTTFGQGTFPDGITFDSTGGLWVTSIVSNRVIRVDAGGHQEIILEDSDHDHVNWVEAAFISNTMGRPHLDSIKSTRLSNISSLAFGGSEFRTAYLGSLLGKNVVSFRAPVAGHPPQHFNLDIKPLIRTLGFT
jgi:sugar lactone lactonase YvrE